METKLLRGPAYIKSVSDRTVTGLFSLYGNIDSTGDIVHPGAMAGAQPAKMLFLWQHSFDQPPVARLDSIKEVSRAQLPQEVRVAFPEATGGAFVTRTYLDTPMGNTLLANIKAGVPLQQSFGFNARVFDFTKGPNGEQVRNLRLVDIMECSDVLWGANSGTRTDIGASEPVTTRAWLRQTGLEIAALQLDLLTTGLPAPPAHGAPTLPTLRRQLAQLDPLATRARSHFERK